MNQNKIIYGILIGLILSIAVFAFFQKRRIDKLKTSVVSEQLEGAEELIPVIQNERNEIVITTNQIEEQSRIIQILLDSMENLEVDTLSLSEALDIIKDRANKNEVHHINNSDLLRY